MLLGSRTARHARTGTDSTVEPPAFGHARPRLGWAVAWQGQRTASYTRHSRTRRPGAAQIGDARPTQRRTSSRNTPPARPVRGRPRKTDGFVDRPCGPDAVRYLSVDPATQRSTALQGDTPPDREKTARLAENSQLTGRFRRWWQVLGSNQRRLSRRFWSDLSSWPDTCANQRV